MITEIQIAQSNRSHCNKCGESIPVGSKRGVELKPAYGHLASTFYCTICTKIILSEQIENSTKLLTEILSL